MKINNLKNFFWGSKLRRIASIGAIVTTISLTLLILAILFGSFVWQSSIKRPIGEKVTITNLEASLSRSDISGINDCLVKIVYDNNISQDKVININNVYLVANDNRVIYADNLQKQSKLNTGDEQSINLNFPLPGNTQPKTIIFEYYNDALETIEYAINAEDLSSASDIYQIPSYLLDTQIMMFSSHTIPQTPRPVMNSEAGSEAIKNVLSQLNKYINDPASGKKLTLNEAGIELSVPQTSMFIYQQTQPKFRDYENGDLHNMEKDCNTLDPKTLKVTPEKFYCKYYTVYFELFSPDMSFSTNNSFYVYMDGIPTTNYENIVNTQTQLLEKQITIFNKKYTLQQFVKSTRGNFMSVSFLNTNGKPVTFIMESRLGETLNKTDEKLFWKLGETVLSTIK